MDYLRRLPPAERAWAERFLDEYYNTNNTLLRPEKHLARCRKCRAGGDCGRRPPPKALHASDALRQDCYRRQWWASQDAYSMGRVSLWADFDRVNESGEVQRTTGDGASRRARVEAGDYEDTSEMAPAAIRARKKR